MLTLAGRWNGKLIMATVCLLVMLIATRPAHAQWPDGSMVWLPQPVLEDFLAAEAMLAAQSPPEDAGARDWLAVLQQAATDEQAAIAMLPSLPAPPPEEPSLFSGFEHSRNCQDYPLLAFAVEFGFGELAQAYIEQLSGQGFPQQLELDNLLTRAVSVGDVDMALVLAAAGARLEDDCLSFLAGRGLEGPRAELLGQLAGSAALAESNQSTGSTIARIMPFVDETELLALLERSGTLASEPDKGTSLLNACLDDSAKFAMLVEHGYRLAPLLGRDGEHPMQALHSLAIQYRYAEDNDVQVKDEAGLMRILATMGFDIHELAALPAGEDSEGMSALDYVVTYPSPDLSMYALLAEWGVALDSVDDEGRNALHALSFRDYGTADDVRQLVALGLDPDLRDKQGRTPADLALLAGREELGQALLALATVPDPAAQGGLGEIEQFSEGLADFGPQDAAAAAALAMEIAAKREDAATVRAILAMGYSPTLPALFLPELAAELQAHLASGDYLPPGVEFEHPVRLALHAERPQAVASLLADERIRSGLDDDDLYRMLDLALMVEMNDVAKALIEAGAQIEKPGGLEDYDSPLLGTAATRDSPEMLQWLLERGADPDYGLVHNEQYDIMVGEPALDRVTSHYYFDDMPDGPEVQLSRMRVLLEAGANPDFYTDRGYGGREEYAPVLLQVIYEKNLPMLQLMLEYGANPQARTIGGELSSRPLPFRMPGLLAQLLEIPGLDQATLEQFLPGAGYGDLVMAMAACAETDNAGLLAVLNARLGRRITADDGKEVVNACLAQDAPRCMEQALELMFPLPSYEEALLGRLGAFRSYELIY